METIIVTSRDALNSAIPEALETALKQHLPAVIQRATSKPYLTKPELMELTDWSSRQVEYKKSSGELPYVRRGRLVIFPADAVFAYLEAGLVAQRKPITSK